VKVHPNKEPAMTTVDAPRLTAAHTVADMAEQARRDMVAQQQLYRTRYVAGAEPLELAVLLALSGAAHARWMALSKSAARLSRTRR
jgi:hypothetical protein